MTFDIDWTFIARQEGAAITEGYVPTDGEGRVLGQSGVTIATGFDLGQHDRAYLDRVLAGNPDIIAALAPYLGLRRTDAVEALARTPLTVTAEEAQTIDRAVKSDKVAELAPVYNAAVTLERNERLLRFRDLPREAQTVIMSVAFQYGRDLARRTPRFWAAAVSQDWARTVEELETFGDRYAARRRREAEYLSRLVVTQ